MDWSAADGDLGSIGRLNSHGWGQYIGITPETGCQDLATPMLRKASPYAEFLRKFRYIHH
jgi:hypothetical protein